MKFELLPLLERMKEFYELPRTKGRFEKYLFMLQGDKKDDIVLPIAGYNPMGKENVLMKIQELLDLEAEKLLQIVLNEINDEAKKNDGHAIHLAINLVDDIGGAWSNFHTTDYSSKFDMGALIKRNFCTPFFWTSETYTKDLIIQRTREYVYRTVYWIHNGKPQSLHDHFEQEVFVQLNTVKGDKTSNDESFAEIKKFYSENFGSEDYNLIFNFFYGDEASDLLKYATYGRKENEGFDYAQYESQREKSK